MNQQARFVIFAFALSSFCPLTGLAQSGDSSVSFNRDIRSILSDRCFQCHGPDENERAAELRLDRADGAEGAHRTVDGSTAIKPGSLESSEVWKRIITADLDELMPPPEANKKPLTDVEKNLIKSWIEAGAKYEDFWAFEAPKPPRRPSVSDQGWSNQAIDQYVLRRLEREALHPKPRADRRTLIRRLTLDLTGLPPTRKEIAQFLADDQPNAYERLVDRLLERPQFGEHIARYWLDLVRFADTNGIHHDHFRDQSPYRDWVIRAFNQNLPYDEFVRYQLAGDLFPEATQEQLVASGFHRLHRIIDRGTMLPEESQARNVIDRVTAVSTSFMGLTVQCAVCHDHKYDPITSQDFYQLYAFFNNIDANPETGGRSGSDFKKGLQPPYISLATLDQEATATQLQQAESMAKMQVDDLKKRIKELDQKEADKEKAEQEKAEQEKAEQEKAEQEKAEQEKAEQEKAEQEKAEQEKAEQEKAEQEKAEQEKAEQEKVVLQHKLKEAEDLLAAAKSERNSFELTLPAAMVMKERTETRPSHIMIRGDYANLGAQVTRQTPAFLPPLQPQDAELATRMDLANWFVRREHPLTARVAVNRFWQQLFGVGIVKTSEDLGTQGEWPSHPELLDYLAWTFVENGWDVKALFKEMALSETYCQVSDATPEEFGSDPENRLLSRASRYRLDSEVIRDQILATSGLLVSEMYGKSVKPPQPAGLWKAVALPSSYPNVFTADTGDKIRRRSVYTFWKRGLPPPQMTILNAPTREECIARRERTNTPLQALLLLNEQEYLKAARQLASNILQEDPEKRLSVLYETVTAQVPDATEAAVLEKTLNDLQVLYRGVPELSSQLTEGASLEGTSAEELAAWTVLVNTLYNLDITKTRQ